MRINRGSRSRLLGIYGPTAKEGSMVLAQFVTRLANMDKISRRMSQEGIIEYLEEKGVAEELRVHKKWHPETPR